jgi:hypothetical protein
MSDAPWICTPSVYSGYARKYANSFVGTESQDQGKEWGERNWAGYPLPAESFPAAIFATQASKDTAYKLPHLFSDANFWVVSDKVCNIMKEADLGEGNLYPVKVLQVDRQTPVGGYWYCLNFGNRRSGLLVEQSARMYETYVYGGTKAWMPKETRNDGDIVLDSAVLAGPEIWIDPVVADAFFLSARLGSALKSAKVDKAFQMTRCGVV